MKTSLAIIKIIHLVMRRRFGSWADVISVQSYSKVLRKIARTNTHLGAIIANHQEGVAPFGSQGVAHCLSIAILFLFSVVINDRKLLPLVNLRETYLFSRKGDSFILNASQNRSVLRGTFLLKDATMEQLDIPSFN